jgi:hypothetical protein
MVALGGMDEDQDIKTPNSRHTKYYQEDLQKHGSE